MTITLAEFVIEEGSDFVTLYDGLTLLSPPMLQLTRNYTNDTTLNFVTNTKTMLIYFHSNGKNVHKGFDLFYEAE